MARSRGVDGRRWFDRRPSLAYARTSGVWQTRQGRRNRELATFANLLGLNTSLDDMHKKDGESPYLRNVRYMGEKQIYQRAQAMSRYGQGFLKSIGDVKSYPDKSDAQTYIEVYEGKAIEFDIEFTKTLIGGMLYVQNIDGAKGALRVMLKKDADSEVICDAMINLEGVQKLDYDKKEFRFIQGVEETNIAGGKATIRIEIIDDVDQDVCGSAPVKGRIVRLLATGEKNHRSANYELPNTDMCLHEQPYDFTQEPGQPLFGIRTNGLKPMLRGTLECCDKTQYLIFPVMNNGVVELYRQDVTNNGDPIKITLHAPIYAATKAVRFSKEMEGYIYYVDGESPLRRMKMCDWTTEDVVPLASEIDTTITTDPAELTAKPGASIIYKLRNRIYLGGFKDDPNFVQFSLIDGNGAQPKQYNEGFYSPDRSPKDSTCSPNVAFASLDTNLVVFRNDGNSVFSAPTGLEFGKAQQLDTFASNIGVANQESVVEGNGNIYLYNKTEGFRRFAGTDSSFQSIAIDNELRRIKDVNKVFLLAHGNKVRFWFDRNDSGHISHQFVYHTILAGSSPWYMDGNTPVQWAIGDQTSDMIYAMHSQYPATFIVDKEDQFTDFDSSIKFEYDTQYKSPGSLMGKTILRRVQVKVIANSTNSWFIGVDYDHRDNPVVWRKFVKGQEDTDTNEDAIFSNTADAGAYVINLMMRAQCRDFQVRVATYCYRSQAELLMIVGEYGGVDPL